MKRVSLSDIELATVDQGAGAPLLLVHGFPLDHTMWKGQVDELAEGRRIIAPDLRGFGESGVTPGAVAMERFADDLASLLDALEIDEPVVLCGLSMGGYIALEFWRRHASRLRGLVLCDTRAAPDTQEAREKRLETAANVEADGVAALAETMIPKLFAQESLEKRSDLVEATRETMRSAPPQGVSAALRGMAGRADFSDRLREIETPSLLLVGERDSITPPEEMREIAARLPNARFETIPSAGHLAPLENPTRVNAAIREFLAGS